MPPLDWTDRGTQTSRYRAYSPFICNLRTVAADIALPMNAVTIDVTRVRSLCDSAWLQYQYTILHRVVTLGNRLRAFSDNCMCGL
ncbi:hypothetical protein TNCV_3789451 [Trichonephila clavipes]|nr:hypothetical protein TNCV_3789451 [Trichonephila clavipes]